MKTIRNAKAFDELSPMNIPYITTRSVVRVCIAIAMMMGIASFALCCSIPVYRYALEHWTPEAFTVHIISTSPLDESQKSLLKELETLSKNANVRLKISDGQNEPSDESKAIRKRYADRDSAWLVVEAAKKVVDSTPVIWDGPFTQETVTRLLSSPMRQRICQGLVEKDSVCWVFLESGDATVDDKKFALLESELRRLEKIIKLPEIEAADLKDLSKKPEELKIQFSSHRLSRSDASEAAFVSMLLATESDLREEFEVGTPMAFPVFGRGRVLYALLGDGIAKSTIEEASRFLAGACQCTVKADNPGVDLLISFDWDEHVQITEPKKEDVPLSGLGSFANRSKAVKPSDAAKPLDAVKPSETVITSDAVTPSDAVTATVIATPIDSFIQSASEVSSDSVFAKSSPLITLGVLAAIVGSITIGWMFFFGSKS